MLSKNRPEWDQPDTTPEASERTLGDLRASLALDWAHDAFVSIDTSSRILRWNRAAERTFGFSASEAMGRPLPELIIPEHLREAHRRGLERYLQTGVATVLGQRLELEALHRDGHSFPVEMTIAPVAVAGEVVFNAFVHAISDRRRAERSQQDLTRRLEGAFARAPIGMALTGVDGRFLAVNEALCQMLGRCEAELLATDFQSLTHPDDVGRDLEFIAAVLDGQRSTYAVEKRYRRSDGSYLWSQLNVSLVRDHHDRPSYFVAQYQDISERKEAEEELERYTAHLGRLAERDPLTGLPGEAAFKLALDRLLGDVRHTGEPFSIVRFDLARMPDRDGGSAPTLGDEILRHAARAISSLASRDDEVARIDGDAFAVLVRGASRDQATASAERVAGELAARLGGERPVIAAVSSPEDGDSAPLLLLRSEMRLRAAAADRQERPGRGELSGGGPQSAGVRRMLEIARQELGLETAYLTQIDAGETTLAVRSAAGDLASFGLERDRCLELGGTLCTMMLDGSIPGAVPDTSREPELAGHPAPDHAGIGAYLGVPVRLSDGTVYGTLCALSRDPKPELGSRELAVMRFLAHLIGDLIERERVEAHEQRRQTELAGIHALLAALSARDHYTAEHSHSVVELAGAVARRLGLPSDLVGDVERVALLHDIGKVGIPDAILQKRAKLNEREWALMRQHPAIGARILSDTATLRHLADAVRAEHERFDGTGYPDRLRGEQIPLASRIAFACDAYHAITSDRPYRRALDHEHAIAELRAGAGSQFDPAVIAALVAVLDGAPPEISTAAGPSSAAAGTSGAPAPTTSDAGTADLTDRTVVLAARRPRRSARWAAATTDDRLAIGRARASCDRCGAHVMVTVTEAAVGGSCPNCGGYDLSVVAA